MGEQENNDRDAYTNKHPLPADGDQPQRNSSARHPNVLFPDPRNRSKAHRGQSHQCVGDSNRMKGLRGNLGWLFLQDFFFQNFLSGLRRQFPEGTFILYGWCGCSQVTFECGDRDSEKPDYESDD